MLRIKDNFKHKTVYMCNRDEAIYLSYTFCGLLLLFMAEEYGFIIKGSDCWSTASGSTFMRVLYVNTTALAFWPATSYDKIKIKELINDLDLDWII